MFVFLYVSAWRGFHEAPVMCLNGGWDFLLVSVCTSLMPICPHICYHTFLHSTLFIWVSTIRVIGYTVARQYTFDEEDIERSGISFNHFFDKEFWSDDVPLAVKFHSWFQIPHLTVLCRHHWSNCELQDVTRHCFRSFCLIKHTY